MHHYICIYYIFRHTHETSIGFRDEQKRITTRTKHLGMKQTEALNIYLFVCPVTGNVETLITYSQALASEKETEETPPPENKVWVHTAHPWTLYINACPSITLC